MFNEDKYVHGYSEYESNRLTDQANTLNKLLHFDSIFPVEANVLEIGCGVGSQTEILCRQNPSVRLTSVDISKSSLHQARLRCDELGIQNVTFVQADVYKLPFAKESFDSVFICFLLEHLADPDIALQKLKVLLKPGGSISIIEGDHGSAFYYPESHFAQATIDCLIKLQAKHGGNSLIGRSLYPLLDRNHFKNISVSPRMVYADTSNPEMVEGFTRKTFIAMVEGIQEQAITGGMIAEADWKKGIDDLNKSADREGVFCYTFFKASAII
jgi:ubiquinone/menaquinone biosynthesis C-methylase UbiE